MMKRQAILIIAHNNLRILQKNLLLLDSEYFDFYIHIDKKSKIEIEDLKDICKISKVYLFKKINILWSDYSQVKCELFLLKKAASKKYTYYHLISGADFALKPAKIIYDFFENSGKKEFITYENVKISKYKLDWIKYYYFFNRYNKNNKFLKLLDNFSILIQKVLLINRIKNDNVKYMNGDNWFSITHECAKYVLKNVENFESKYKYTKSYDEIFLHTLVYNSYFKKSLYSELYNDNHEASMRHIDWKRGKPYTFKIDDYDELINSKCMFARKFDENIDMNIVNKLYSNIKGKE